MIDDVIPQRDRVELRMSAQPENLALARLALSGVAASVGAPDEVVGDLTDWCNEQWITAARVTGVGDFSSATVAWFDTDYGGGLYRKQ